MKKFHQEYSYHETFVLNFTVTCLNLINVMLLHQLLQSLQFPACGYIYTAKCQDYLKKPCTLTFVMTELLDAIQNDYRKVWWYNYMGTKLTKVLKKSH